MNYQAEFSFSCNHNWGSFMRFYPQFFDFFVSILFAISLNSVVAFDQVSAGSPFIDGDNVALLGDRSTRLGLWHRYVAEFYATRFPQRTVSFVVCSHFEQMHLIADRLQMEYFGVKPTVAVFSFGLTGCEFLFQNSLRPDRLQLDRRDDMLAKYKIGLEFIARRVKDGQVKRLILTTPFAYDNSPVNPAESFPGLNEALAACGHNVFLLARRLQAGLVDVHGPMSALLKEAENLKSYSGIIELNRSTPTPAGHLIMAWIFLKSQGVPGFISRISLHVKYQTTTRCRGVKIQGIKWNSSGFEGTVLEECLPWPLDPDAQSALVWAPGIQDLNQQEFVCGGLDPGKYDLMIDDVQIGTWNANELENGINISAIRSTPQCLQAKAVQRLCEERLAIILSLLNLREVEGIWFGNRVDLGNEKEWTSALEKFVAANGGQERYRAMAAQYRTVKSQEVGLIKLFRELSDHIREAAQPVPHTYKLIRQGE